MGRLLMHSRVVRTLTAAWAIAGFAAASPAQNVPPEQLEAARQRLEERQRAAAAASRPAGPGAATRPSDGLMATLAEAARRVTEVAAERPPRDATWLKAELWRQVHAERLREATAGLTGRRLSANLVVEDVCGGDRADAAGAVPAWAQDVPSAYPRVRARVWLGPPPAVVAAGLTRAAMVGASYDGDIAAAAGAVKAAKDPAARRRHEEDLAIAKHVRDEAVAAARLKFASTRQAVDVVVVATDERFGVLRRGATVRGAFDVWSADVSPWRVGDDFDLDPPGASRVVLGLYDPAVGRSGVVGPRLPRAVAAAPPPAVPPAGAAAPGVAAVPPPASAPAPDDLAGALRATFARTEAIAADEPPAALTTLQLRAWRDARRARLAEAAADPRGRRYPATLRVVDVVPTVDAARDLSARGLRVALPADGAAVVSALALADPGPAAPQAMVLLYAADDRFADRSKGDVVAADVEVAEVFFRPAARRLGWGASEEMVVVARATAPPAGPVPATQRWVVSTPLRQGDDAGVEPRQVAAPPPGVTANGGPAAGGGPVAPPAAVPEPGPGAAAGGTAARPGLARPATKPADPKLSVVAPPVGPPVPLGRRVVFLVDASESMAACLDDAKAEVARAMRQLPAGAQFSLVIDQRGSARTTFRGLVPLTADNVGTAERLLASVKAAGTDRVSRGVAAVAPLGPDVVWYYTDGDYDDPTSTFGQLKAAADKGGFKVNTLARLAAKGDVRGVFYLARAGGGACVDEDGRAIALPPPPPTPSRAGGSSAKRAGTRPSDGR
jgi:hypothetical protein